MQCKCKYDMRIVSSVKKSKIKENVVKKKFKKKQHRIWSFHVVAEHCHCFARPINLLFSDFSRCRWGTRGKEKPPEQPKKRAYILKNAFKFLHFKISKF